MTENATLQQTIHKKWNPFYKATVCMLHPFSIPLGLVYCQYTVQDILIPKWQFSNFWKSLPILTYPWRGKKGNLSEMQLIKTITAPPSQMHLPVN